jgi:hypothetical protein
MRISFNLNDNGICRMCDNGLIETRDHLFWSCPFSLQCWHSIIKLEDNMDLSQICYRKKRFWEAFLFLKLLLLLPGTFGSKGMLIFSTMLHPLLDLGPSPSKETFSFLLTE